MCHDNSIKVKAHAFDLARNEFISSGVECMGLPSRETVV